MAEELPALVVPLPRRLDRRMRLGPFPSARDAMKFAAYAAAGTFTLPVGGAMTWLPFLGVAFLISVYRPGGKGLDERAVDYVRWHVRRRRGNPGGVGTAPGFAPDGCLRLPGPYLGAVVESGGIPTRFLPPADARELFDQYRALLRNAGAGLLIDVGLTAIPIAGFRLPPIEVAGAGERAAHEGYAEMLRLLVRRRMRRRILLVVFVPLSGAGSSSRLDAEVGELVGRLAALGTEPVRLRGAALRAAAEALGWPSGVGS